MKGKKKVEELCRKSFQGRTTNRPWSMCVKEREKVFQRILESDLENEFADEWKNLKKSESFYLVLLQIDRYYLVLQDLTEHQKLISMDEKIRAAITEIIRDKGEGIASGPGEYCLILRESNRSQAKTVGEAVVENCKAIGYSVSATLGSKVVEVEELKQAYHKAREMMSYRFAEGGGRLIERADNDRSQPKNEIFNSYKLRQAVVETDRDRLDTELECLLKALVERGARSYLYTQMMISEIFVGIIRSVEEMGANMEEVFPDMIEEYKNIFSQSTAECIIGEFRKMLLRIVEYLQLRKSGEITELVVKGKQYINRNFRDANLSLRGVALEVGISPGYFSTEFKHYVGYTFTDYLTLVRIQSATELLKNTGLLIYEVAAKVGYLNSTYFSTLFKREKGVSPAEYRKL